jgi:DNA-binding SARP family transcriptional activator/tetratricopeptide (TPR) repeat protein
VIGIRVLGPLEADVDGVPADLGGPRQRCVLARLIAGHGRVVSADRLIEDLYADGAPPRALAAVHAYVSHLRRALEPDRATRGPAQILVTAPPGYALRLGADAVDGWSFEEDVHQAAVLDDPAATHARLSTALARWRGPAFGEFSGLPWADLEAARLDELRLSATEARAQAALRLGRAAQTVAELSRMTTEYPLREEAWRLLALALYQCGRQGDALTALRRARIRLATDLGIDPGPALRDLEEDILAQDPRLTAPEQHQATATVADAGSDIPARADARPAVGSPPPSGSAGPPEGAAATPVVAERARRPVPRLLPTDIADFTGRAEQVRQIRSNLVRAAADDARLAVPVVVVTGPGGVGKTSLAVHVAHGLAARFPHGQLFADLHGGSADPVGPMQVLERFLRTLGMPGGQLPSGLDERAEAYRDLLAGRRVLVVLDDAASEAQVLALLPGSAAAAVLVTSRARLAGVPGAAHVELGVFDSASSADLLSRIAGAERVEAQPAAVAAVAEQCGHLPLALRIAGARLAARPHWSIGQLAERLADETRRLDELIHGDLGVRASIWLSYAGTSEKAQRLLRRLALLDVPVLSGWVGAALLDQPPAEAADLLDELVAAQLVQASGTGTGADVQYRLHELIKVFARERLATEEPAAEQAAALGRALGALLYLAGEAMRRVPCSDAVLLGTAPLWQLPAGLTDQLLTNPLAWLERERAALVCGVRQAARAGQAGLSWNMAFSALPLLTNRAYFDDWRDTHEVALRAAREAGDVRGQAVMLYSLGVLHVAQQRYDQSRRESSAALRLFQDIGDEQGAALAMRDIGFADRVHGRLDDAARCWEQALATFRGVGNQLEAGAALLNIAQIKLQRGELGQARELLSEALALARAARSGRVEAQVLRHMGEAALLAGEPASAAGAFGSALARVRELGDLIGEAIVLQGLGVARLRQAEFAEAMTTLQRSRELAVAAGHGLAEARALLALAELALASGDPAQAAVTGQQALAKFRAIGALLYQARALTLLTDAYTAAGDTAAARATSAQAAALQTTPGAEASSPQK